MVGPEREIFNLYHLKQLLTAFFKTFLSDWRTLDLQLVTGDFYNKRIVLKNYVKSHLKILLIKLCRIPHACRKGSSLFL